MPPLLGRREAAVLLAVEAANGGELAPLEQVVVAFEGMFRTAVEPGTFTDSVGLLVDAELVDWLDAGLELSVRGRRTIRRAAAHWDPHLPDKVAERLSLIEEEDLAPEGERPAPEEADVAEALVALGRGRRSGQAPVPRWQVAPEGMDRERRHRHRRPG